MKLTQKELSEYRALVAEKAQIGEMLAELDDSPSRSPEGNAIRSDEVRRHYTAKQAEITRKLLAIEDAIASLSPNERRLFRLRYLQGMKWDAVCDELGYCRQQVFRIHKKALRKLENGEKK